MSEESRSTLKSYFETGDAPTEGEFSNLIDSVSNTVDDVQVISEITSNYTLLSTDKNKFLEIIVPPASGVIITLPGNLEVGFKCSVCFSGASDGGAGLAGDVGVFMRVKGEDSATVFAPFTYLYSVVDVLYKGGGIWYVWGDINLSDEPVDPGPT